MASMDEETATYNAALHLLADCQLDLTDEQRRQAAYFIVAANWRLRKVEPGQPASWSDTKPGRPQKYPWASLGVGQTQMVDGGDSVALRASFIHWCKRNNVSGARITTHKVAGGVEVTRTA